MKKRRGDEMRDDLWIREYLDDYAQKISIPVSEIYMVSIVGCEGNRNIRVDFRDPDRRAMFLDINSYDKIKADIVNYEDSLKKDTKTS